MLRGGKSKLHKNKKDNSDPGPRLGNGQLVRRRCTIENQ